MANTHFFAFVISKLGKDDSIMSAVSSTTGVLEPTSRLKKLPTYVFAWLDDLKAAARAQGADLIDLGMGNPDQPVAAPILKTIQDALGVREHHGYPPFKGHPWFREAAANWMQRRYGVTFDPETEVLCVSGSKEGIADITRAYIDQGDISLVGEIYYPVLSRATWLVGGDVYHLPMPAEKDFVADFDNVPEDVLKKARLLFLNYPNNPTGGAADLAYYEKAVAFCKKHHIVLVSDLAYGEITFDGYIAPSVFQVEGAKDIAIEFHSVSKSFNMAGSRLGFAVGNPEILNQLYALRTNGGYGTPSYVQAGAAEAFNNAETYLKPTVETYQRRRDVVIEGFRSLGWEITPPKATLYVWLRVPKGFQSQAWTEYLIKEAGVVVSPGNAFGDGGEGFFRVSLVSPEENLQAAIERLRQKGIRYEG